MKLLRDKIYNLPALPIHDWLISDVADTIRIILDISNNPIYATIDIRYNIVTNIIDRLRDETS